MESAIWFQNWDTSLKIRKQYIRPCHSCDYVDIFMGELDDKLVEKMEEEDIEHTEFRIFRDDAWDILLNADNDLPQFEEILG